MLLKQNQYLDERKKLILLSLAACFIAASYAILRPLKASVFFQIVGKEYYPYARMFMIIAAIPALSLYSKLVDKLTKNRLLYCLFSFYSILMLIFSYLLSHPVYGIYNTNPNNKRFLGWAFSIAIDLYPTFVIGVFWAFINSTSTNQFAKNSYGFIYAFIKIGSLIAVLVGFLLTQTSQATISTIPILVSAAAICTFLPIIFIGKIIKKIPQNALSGYATKKELETLPKKHRLFEGFWLILTKPYVFGLFLLFYIYDVIFTLIEYKTQFLLSDHVSGNLDQFSSFLYLSAAIAQLISLVIAIFATSNILNHIAPRYSLLIMPAITLVLMILLICYPNLITMLATITLLPAIHYSLNSPIRETLFIPTVKDIQFKSKAWIDSFGRTFSKSSGAAGNLLSSPAAPFSIGLLAISIISLLGAWGIVAYFMGKKYEKTINQNELVD